MNGATDWCGCVRTMQKNAGVHKMRTKNEMVSFLYHDLFRFCHVLAMDFNLL